MGLDLDDVMMDWDCLPGEVSARVVEGLDGQELVQLRVDLGILQMYPDGRPDGDRYHGLPSVLEYLQHELRVGRDNIGGEHWIALDREITQLNYRRVALASMAEQALHDQDEDEAERHLIRVLRDIDLCLAALVLLEERRGAIGTHAQLWPTLVFNRARLMSQLRVVQADYDGAIEAADDGAAELEALLGDVPPEYDCTCESDGEFADDEDEDEEDPAPDDGDDNVGVVYLRELGRQLRVQYNVGVTLRERWEEAVEAEDYELAANLHRELVERESVRNNRRQRLLGPNLN